jgi:hypothetical protein
MLESGEVGSCPRWVAKYIVYIGTVIRKLWWDREPVHKIRPGLV